MTVFINWPSTAATEEEKEGPAVTKVVEVEARREFVRNGLED